MLTQQASKENQCTKQLGCIHQTISCFNEIVDRLEARVSSVLQPPYPTTDSGNNKIQEALVPFAEQLKGLDLKIIALKDRVNEIVQRIEI